jgi:phage major head subunit gpT-like protein
MVITQGNVAAIFKGYTTKFWEAFAGSPAPMSEQLTMNVPSSGLSEEHNWLSATAGIRELVDEATVNPLRAQNYAIVNKEYEETLGLRQLDVLGDRFGILAPRLQILGANARYYRDIMLGDLLVKAFDGTTTDYMDGTFFASNKTAYAGATAFTNVTTGRLTAARFSAARANLKKRTNHAGRILGLGRDLTLIVGPDDEQTALEILSAERLENGATNVNKGTAKLIVWPQIAAISGLDRSWYLVDMASPFKPFIHQTLLDWSYFTVDNPQDSFVLKYHEFLYQIYSARAVGFGFPECIYGSDGTVP